MGCGASSEEIDDSGLKSAGRECEVLLIVERATKVPKLDLTGESDPYVTIKVFEGKVASKSRSDKVLSEPKRTLCRQDNPNPVWNAHRKITVHTTLSYIDFTLFDEDLVTKDDIIGSVCVDFSEFTFGETKSLNIKGDCELLVRIEELDESIKSDCAKRLICIRHGESQWNEGQENLDIKAMYEQKDHPLNSHGIGQAMALNAAWKEIDSMDDPSEKLSEYGMTKDDFDAFKSAQIIYASPLCRASQTCILSLLDHPTLTDKGLTLMSTIREKKNIGGLDTAASTCGEDIRPRVEEQTKEVYNGDDKDARLQEWNDKFGLIKWDFNDTYEKWWTDTFDSKEEVLRRFDDVFQLLRYIPESTIVLVGHSLFFQAFFRNYLNTGGDDDDLVEEDDATAAEAGSEEAKAPEPEVEMDAADSKEKLYRQLKKGKLMNAGCALCDVRFSDSLEKSFEITEVQLMFGTKLVK